MTSSFGSRSTTRKNEPTNHTTCNERERIKKKWTTQMTPATDFHNTRALIQKTHRRNKKETKQKITHISFFFFLSFGRASGLLLFPLFGENLHRRTHIDGKEKETTTKKKTCRRGLNRCCTRTVIRLNVTRDNKRPSLSFTHGACVRTQQQRQRFLIGNQTKESSIMVRKKKLTRQQG